ncbi:NADPH:quinone oxidoreductase family protein [Pseudooceanicola sp. CBS1P-1]|uniref:Zinc-binding dehydrogenase n=1 Tax=Pseudooceanicola albus TaxID=2692189 RepID=A0A6L7G1Z9_9RHOB|nr:MULTISPECIES: NADPH:quinone oxidoreductase family protein [Pseudooceanicola]MBT9384693.1 NADPH:quinone oxidoreductase family protein [Pseudooceanicola endophyticus]MXN18394.1 zinc-binding dehydrogenase [Pseudooceanicola albus]
MRALRCNAPGEAPRLERIDRPAFGDNDVLVKIFAAGLNFADTLMIKGSYQDTPTHPFTLGLECAGRVEAAGAASGFTTGTRVAVYSGQGALADYGAFPAARMVALPDAVSYQDAAALQIAYGTSHLALAHRARLKPGETLVVLGATGGVGLTACELGRIMGATVIAVAAGAQKETIARAAGAHHFIDSETRDVRLALKDLGGADVVYDPVGGDLFTAAFRACNPEARILIIGFASGSLPEVRPNHMLVKNIDLLGVYWGAYYLFAPEIVTASIARLLGWLAEGRLKPHISNTFPLEQAMEGLEMLRQRQARGKIIVTP